LPDSVSDPVKSRQVHPSITHYDRVVYNNNNERLGETQRAGIRHPSSDK